MVMHQEGLLGASPFNRVFHTVHMCDVVLKDPLTGETIRCSGLMLKIQAKGGEGVGIIPGDRCWARVRILGSHHVTNPGCERKKFFEPVLLIEHASMIDVVRNHDESQKWNFKSIRDAWMKVVSKRELP